MALPTAAPAPILSPDVVGRCFVEQYYKILHNHPELVHRFYHDSSILSRPDSNGVMQSATTMQAIDDLVLSLDCKNRDVQIKTVDTQPSYNDGVFICVTGCLTWAVGIQRKFTQSFFLAPKDKGVYFVLNDCFRYVDEVQPEETSQVLVDGIVDDAPKAPPTPDQETSSVRDHHVEPAHVSSELDGSGEEICNPVENGGSIAEEEIVSSEPAHPSSSDAPQVSEHTASAVQDDTPKKSYASIVKVSKGNASTVAVYVPTTKAKPAPLNPDKPSNVTSKPAPLPETPATASNDILESSNSSDVEGYSIYIRNLPLNATAPQVEEVFKDFGAIKPGGVQVRNHKVDRFCFGFVEFEASDSMKAAIEASPIFIGGRQAYIEEKKTTTRVVNGVVSAGNGSGVGGCGRGRYIAGRGGFRNDNFRARGGFGGNQGFGRGEFRNRGEYSNRSDYPNRGEYVARGWSTTGRSGESYQQRVVQNGSARNIRPSGMSQTAVTA